MFAMKFGHFKFNVTFIELVDLPQAGERCDEGARDISDRSQVPALHSNRYHNGHTNDNCKEDIVRGYEGGRNERHAQIQYVL